MGTIFPGPRLVAAVVDRVTFNAHILETGIQSYRLRTSEAATRGRKPSWTTAQTGPEFTPISGANHLTTLTCWPGDLPAPVPREALIDPASKHGVCWWPAAGRGRT